MVAQAIISLLVWLHIFSVTGWLGSTLLVELIITPTIPRLSPQSRGELTINLFPKITIFLTIFGGLTIIFGLLLALSVSNGDLGVFGFGSTYGQRIDTGAVLGLISAIIGGAVNRRLGSQIVEMTKRGGSDPEQANVTKIQRLQGRLRTASLASLILLLFALGFMVAAATGV